MSTPNEENFKAYKQSEKQAIEIVAAMKAANARKTDIELALLVAIFELHKADLPPQTIGAIVQGHLKQLIPFYAGSPQSAG